MIALRQAAAEPQQHAVKRLLGTVDGTSNHADSRGGPVSGPTIHDRLRDLHEAHVERVNLVLDEDREDLARELADAYADEALAVILAEGASPCA